MGCQTLKYYKAEPQDFDPTRYSYIVLTDEGRLFRWSQGHDTQWKLLNKHWSLHDMETQGRRQGFAVREVTKLEVMAMYGSLPDTEELNE